MATKQIAISITRQIIVRFILGKFSQTEKTVHLQIHITRPDTPGPDTPGPDMQGPRCSTTFFSQTGLHVPTTQKLKYNKKIPVILSFFLGGGGRLMDLPLGEWAPLNILKCAPLPFAQFNFLIEDAFKNNYIVALESLTIMWIVDFFLQVIM